MKGIYLTQEGKQEIESIIENLKNPAPHWDGIYVSDKMEERREVFEEILSSATILPVYESLGHAMQNKDLDNPNGVIIQPK